jgi:hypothetical protein
VRKISEVEHPGGTTGQSLDRHSGWKGPKSQDKGLKKQRGFEESWTALPDFRSSVSLFPND